MATAAPVTLGAAWTLIGATGFEYLVDLNSGSAVYAFGGSAPGGTIIGHSMAGSQVITPPGSDNVYARAVGTRARVTITAGNALS